MSNGPPIPEIQHFQSLTLKIQGQGHSSRSQSRNNTLSTLIPFVPRQSPVTFLGYSYFKIWHWKFKVKVISKAKVESQRGSDIQSTHIHFVPCESGIPFLSCDFFKICPWKSRAKVMRGEVTLRSHNVSLRSYRLTYPFVPCQSGNPFLSYDSFKIWPWKSSVKVMGEVTVQSHCVGAISYRLTSLSFHVNRASHSWVTTFSKLDLENLWSRSWVRSHFKVTMWV